MFHHVKIVAWERNVRVVEKYEVWSWILMPRFLDSNPDVGEKVVLCGTGKGWERRILALKRTVRCMPHCPRSPDAR
jgi:hypothetical protein